MILAIKKKIISIQARNQFYKEARQHPEAETEIISRKVDGGAGHACPMRILLNHDVRFVCDWRAKFHNAQV